MEWNRTDSQFVCSFHFSKAVIHVNNVIGLVFFSSESHSKEHETDSYVNLWFLSKLKREENPQTEKKKNKRIRMDY